MDKLIYCTETIKNDLVKQGYKVLYEEVTNNTKYYIFDYIKTKYPIGENFFIINKMQL